MSDAVAKAIDTEIAAIERDIVLNPDPRQKRLRHLHQVRDHYIKGMSADVDLADLVKETAVRLHHVTHVVRHAGRKPDPQRLMAISALKAFLRDKKEPVRTSVLYQHLVDQGISLRGSDPTNNLSAMLYHAPEFRSHRRAGWTLRGEAMQ